VQLLLYPGHTLPTAAAPVVVAVGLAIHDRVFAFVPALVAFLGSWFIHVGGVFTDNYELLRRHPDIHEHPELTRAVRDGSLRLSDLRTAILICFGGALLAGLYLLPIGGIPVLVLGALGAAASVAYAGGPIPYAKHGLADVLFFIMFGFVAVVGTYYIQAASLLVPQELPIALFVVGLPMAALVTGVLIIDDIRDHEFDAAKGWRTPAVRYGVQWSRAEFTALVAFAYLAPFAVWLGLGFTGWVLLPLLTLPFAYHITRAVRTLARREDLVSLTPRMAGLSLAHSTLLAIGLALS
jgi:1,4-dihydroxy-2-naphthoate octaprenyltransferase